MKYVEFHLIIIINLLESVDDKNTVTPNAGVKNSTCRGGALDMYCISVRCRVLRSRESWVRESVSVVYLAGILI
jgi:hypothetical protein